MYIEQSRFGISKNREGVNWVSSWVVFVRWIQMNRRETRLEHVEMDYWLIWERVTGPEDVEAEDDGSSMRVWKRWVILIMAGSCYLNHLLKVQGWSVAVATSSLRSRSRWHQLDGLDLGVVVEVEGRINCRAVDQHLDWTATGGHFDGTVVVERAETPSDRVVSHRIRIFVSAFSWARRAVSVTETTTSRSGSCEAVGVGVVVAGHDAAFASKTVPAERELRERVRESRKRALS